jgi:hypothetical protein
MPTGSHRPGFAPPRTAVVLLAAGLAAAALSLPASAATDLFYDASLGLPISDDARLFLNVTHNYYGSSRQAVGVLSRCADPADDFPVVMFMAQASGRRADAVLAMRAKHIAWSDVMVRLQVPPDRLFAGLERDPGPPYGNAWGRWKKTRGGRGGKPAPLVLDDRAVQDLVRLQIASGALRVNPYTIVSERQRGMTVDRFVVIHSQPSGAVAAKNTRGPRPEKGQGHRKPHPVHAER